MADRKSDLFTGFLILLVITLKATQTSVASNENLQPYINAVEKHIGKGTNSSDRYTENIKKELEKDHPISRESYTEHLKKTHPELSHDTAESFTAEQKKVIPVKEEGGAIRALHEGRSELEMKKAGPIHHAVGLRYGVSPTRSLQGDPGYQVRDFNVIYGSNSAPEISLFYEYQPFHSEWFGNLGIIGNLGFNYFKGVGRFGRELPIANTGEFFSTESKTNLKFFAFPLTMGLNYRFNLLRYIRPYVFFGPTVVGFVEMRDDNVTGDCGLFHWLKGNCGNARGLLFSAGASVLMDWLTPSNSWTFYSDYGIKHYYLTIDFSRLSPFPGEFKYTTYGVAAGLSFEY